MRQEIVRAKKPKFKMSADRRYVEKQIVKTHATEIIPRKKPLLIPLLERSEQNLSTKIDRKLFDSDERRIVAERRKEYSNRVRSSIL